MLSVATPNRLLAMDAAIFEGVKLLPYSYIAGMMGRTGDFPLNSIDCVCAERQQQIRICLSRLVVVWMQSIAWGIAWGKGSNQAGPRSVTDEIGWMADILRVDHSMPQRIGREAAKSFRAAAQAGGECN